MAQPRPSASFRERTYPPPYPDGWYRVALSTDLKRGGMRYVECLDQQMVVYRSDVDDSVHAMAAFCPHLGANLAHGCVKAGHVQCPFHGWQLASDGRVAENSVDFQHFGPLHGKMFVPWTRVTVPGIVVQHDAVWELETDPALQHLAYFKNNAVLKVLGRSRRSISTGSPSRAFPACSCPT